MLKMVAGDEVGNFDQIKVGDQVEGVYAEAVAISVVAAPAKAKKYLISNERQQGSSGEPIDL